MNRRRFLEAAGGLAVPALIRSAQSIPQMAQGTQIGDPHANGAVVCGRAVRASRLVVEYAADEGFRNSRRIVGPAATAESDFTARVDLRGLTADRKVFLRAQFEDRDGRTRSDDAMGTHNLRR